MKFLNDPKLLNGSLSFIYRILNYVKCMLYTAFKTMYNVKIYHVE